MWIIPTNYRHSSHFVRDMVESKEDLSLPGLNIESSLMWRSKPSLLRTWLVRWNRGGYIRPLFGRILKPSRWTAFEAELTSSLAVIPANHFRQQANEKEKTIPDTSGLTFSTSSKQLSLFDVSLKTSKDTYLSDSEKSSKTWKSLAIKRRGEYLARLKSARLTRESGCTSWPTQEAFPTPGTTEYRSDTLNLRHRVKQHHQLMLCHHVRLYPTPSARDWKDTPGMAKTATNPDGSERKRNDQLARAVYATENPISGHLNPAWVEWLMGLPTEWTGLGSWETE